MKIKRISLFNLTSTFLWLAFAISIVGSKAIAVDYFSYQYYPRIALNQWNGNCDKSDFYTLTYRVNGGTTLYQRLDQVPLRPGDTLSWEVVTLDRSCYNQPVSLALYASPTNYLDFSEAGLQTLVAHTTVNTQDGSILSIKIPDNFCGPFQLDAVVGRPLPKVGINYAFYGQETHRRASRDPRDMLIGAVNGSLGGYTDQGTCLGVNYYPDKASQYFDYYSYPFNQFSNYANYLCQARDIRSDKSAGLGFYVNGRHIGNNLGYNWGDGTPYLYLKPGDKITYKYDVASSYCYDQKLSLALYRNPAGAEGLRDHSKNQRLVLSDTETIDRRGDYTLNLTVPHYIDGGWQLDVVLGKPLPIVGELGSTYGYNHFRDMLVIAGAGFISKQCSWGRSGSPSQSLTIDVSPPPPGC